MTHSLARFQSKFIQALFDLDSPSSWAAQLAFAVHRNTVVNGCIDALTANFPSVVRLVGDAWFRVAAATFLRLHLPRDAQIRLYGENFADFLAEFEPACDLPYLAEVARLDRFWTEAHGADDVAAVDPKWLTRLSPEAVGDVCLTPHPAARWGWFAQAPIYSIWQRNREIQEVDDGVVELVWRGEGGLLTRLLDDVTWHGVDRSHCAFLDACKAGQQLG